MFSTVVLSENRTIIYRECFLNISFLTCIALTFPLTSVHHIDVFITTQLHFKASSLCIYFWFADQAFAVTKCLVSSSV